MMLNCDNCEVALSGGIDTYGTHGANLCYQCYFAQIPPEPVRPIQINKTIFRKYVYPDQKMIAYSNGEDTRNGEDMQKRDQRLQRTPNEKFIAQLERLATLHKAGVLTVEEFAKAKRKILKVTE